MFVLFCKCQETTRTAIVSYGIYKNISVVDNGYRKQKPLWYDGRTLQNTWFCSNEAKKTITLQGDNKVVLPAHDVVAKYVKERWT